MSTGVSGQRKPPIEEIEDTVEVLTPLSTDTLRQVAAATGRMALNGPPSKLGRRIKARVQPTLLDPERNNHVSWRGLSFNLALRDYEAAIYFRDCLLGFFEAIKVAGLPKVREVLQELVRTYDVR